MRVLLHTDYHLRRIRPMPEQRLYGDHWKGSRRWWRMTTCIEDGIAVILYDPIAV